MLDQFVKFLIMHDALDAYYNSTKNYCNPYFISACPVNWLSRAFPWDRDRSKSWFDLHREWLDNPGVLSSKECCTLLDIVKYIEKYYNPNQVSIF